MTPEQEKRFRKAVMGDSNINGIGLLAIVLAIIIMCVGEAAGWWRLGPDSGNNEVKQ